MFWLNVVTIFHFYLLFTCMDNHICFASNNVLNYEASIRTNVYLFRQIVDSSDNYIIIIKLADLNLKKMANDIMYVLFISFFKHVSMGLFT